MADVFSLATAAPVKGTAGPTQYRPLRDEIREDGARYQLVARAADAEPFVLHAPSGRELPAGTLVDIINAANRERHALRAALAEMPAESKRDESESARAAELNGALKALPRVSALLSAPVARCLMLYSRDDES